MTTADAEDPKYRIESLAKGLRVLRLFDEHTTSLRLREICDRTALPMPTAFRIVATLEQEGYVERTAAGDIAPSVAVLTLGSAALRGSSLVQLADRPLRALAARSGLTINLGTLLGDQVLFLVRIRNTDPVTAAVQVGSTMPAVRTSLGKVMLADLDPADLATRIGDYAALGQDGAPAPVDREGLLREFDGIRAEGYAVQDQAMLPGLHALAVGVRGADGRVAAAISAMGLAGARTPDELRDRVLPELRATAAELSRLLGAS